MASERQNMSEQEISIKAREHELYVPDSDPNAKPVKPFAVYLRETPAEPLSAATKAILWTVGTAVAFLFLAACWRAAVRHTPKSRTTQSRPAAKTAMPVAPFVLPTLASWAQTIRGGTSGTRAGDPVDVHTVRGEVVVKLPLGGFERAVLAEHLCRG
jgi:hypothetical protein